MINIKYNHETIKNKRKEIRDTLLTESSSIKSGKINRISILDLRVLYENYDKHFLDGWFKKNFKGHILYDLSRRLTKSAGITKCPKDIAIQKPEEVRITICIGVDFFFNYDYIEGGKNVCGLVAQDSLEALMIIFEHELIHALEYMMFHISNCKEQRFKDTTRNLFGHTESHHQLPTYRTIASQKLGINISDQVKFQYEQQSFIGFVHNISKRATVLVADQNGTFIDNAGNRYKKFYVPLSILTKV